MQRAGKSGWSLDEYIMKLAANAKIGGKSGGVPAKFRKGTSGEISAKNLNSRNDLGVVDARSTGRFLSFSLDILFKPAETLRLRDGPLNLSSFSQGDPHERRFHDYANQSPLDVEVSLTQFHWTKLQSNR
jgi:hypothetical protein